MKVNNYKVGLEPLDWVCSIPLAHQFSNSNRTKKGYLHFKDFEFDEEETVKQFIYLFAKIGGEKMKEEINLLAEKYNSKI